MHALTNLTFILRPSRTNPQIIPILHGHTPRHMTNLINTDQPAREFKHVIPEGNNDELSVFRSLADVGRYY